MNEIELPEGASAEFRLAVDGIRTADLRQELEIEQITAPAKLATHAIAFAANINAEMADIASDLGTGRFVLLWDPIEQEAWQSRFRIVSFAKSPLETNIGADEAVADVAWAWLTEALENRQATYLNAAGTATRVISSGYGSLSGQSDHAELEMRASWSPVDADSSGHFEAWQDLVCIMSGFPNLPSGVSSFSAKYQR